MGLKHFLFGLSGRVTRKPCWLFILGMVLVYFLILGNVVAAIMAYDLNGEDPETSAKTALIVMLTMLVMAWPELRFW